MPPIVRACYNNLLEHAGAHPVHVITRDNYLDFLSKSPLWSEKVLVYVNNGLVSLTLLSDLIRTSLLYHFGGVWVDLSLIHI